MDDTDFKEAIADFLPALANTFYPDKNVVIDIKREYPNKKESKYLYIPPKNTD
jgi:hypothetical protein